MRRSVVTRNKKSDRKSSEQIQIEVIINKLLGVVDSDVLLLCHKNADPDALGSAFALAQFLSTHKSITCKIYAESLNKPAENLAIRGKIEILNEIDPNAGIVVILDANNLEQVGTVATPPFREILVEKPIIIIDHHAPHGMGAQLTNNYFVLDDVSSTCEIIYRIFKYSATEILPDVAFALLTGIVYDTKHFILASKSTLEAAVNLLDHGADYQEILDVLRVPPPFSERMARLKSAQRMELKRIGNYLLVISQISAFEASAARSLVNLGADVAIVFTTKLGEFRISARCTKLFHTETGVHLGKIFEKAAEKNNGVGGGHRTAAGLNITTKTDPKLVLQTIQNILQEYILVT